MHDIYLIYAESEYVSLYVNINMRIQLLNLGMYHFLRKYFHVNLHKKKNSLGRNLESTFSTSHDQELIEERNEVKPRCSKRTKTLKTFGLDFPDFYVRR